MNFEGAVDRLVRREVNRRLALVLGSLKSGISGGKGRAKRIVDGKRLFKTPEQVAEMVAENGNGKAKKPRKALSPKAAKARKLQGAYMGAMRRLNKGQRATVKGIRAQEGVEAAIKAAQEMAEG